MKLVFACYYSFVEHNFGTISGGTSYGHKFLEPLIQLRTKLEEIGFEVVTRLEHAMTDADIIIIIWDLDNENY